VREPPFDPEGFQAELAQLRALVAGRDAKGAADHLKTMAARY